MPINTNSWNRIRYTLYEPFYDLVAGWFIKQRRRSIALLALKPSEKVLIVGAGTGLDLEFLPRDLFIAANDLTPAMVHQLARRARRLGLEVEARVMDGQNLQYGPEIFDVAILHLILAILPDPVRCIQEVERVLKKGGGRSFSINSSRRSNPFPGTEDSKPLYQCPRHQYQPKVGSNSEGHFPKDCP